MEKSNAATKSDGCLFHDALRVQTGGAWDFLGHKFAIRGPAFERLITNNLKRCI